MSLPAAFRASDRAKLAGWAGLILACAAAVYLPCLRGDFIWNDLDYVTAPALRSWAGLARIWFEPGATQQYYPLLHTAFWAEHRLWGAAPAGYHVVNVLFHAGAAWLFGLCLRRLAVPGAWLAALLFALHPVCVESVAWISEQKNTLSAVFFFAAALAYLEFDRSRSLRAYAGALALFACALLSKTVTATLPGALLVIFWWKRGRLSWRGEVRPLLPWIALGAAAGLFSGWVERKYVGATGPDFAWTFGERCLIAGRLVWFYLGKLLWPAHLDFIYPSWKPDLRNLRQLGCAFAAGALLLALAVPWGAGRWRAMRRACLAVLLLFGGLLFPVLGFFNVYAFLYSFAADHFQYLPSAAVLAGLAGAWGIWRSASARPMLPNLAAATVVCALGLRTARQCGMYRNLEVFYRTIIERNPDAWMAHNNLGNVLHDQKRNREALAQYEAAWRLRPDAEVNYNLGVLLSDLGLTAAAEARYVEALRLRSDYAKAHINLGNLLMAKGETYGAIQHYAAAALLNRRAAEPEYNLGLAYAAVGRTKEAIEHWKFALRMKPDFVEARCRLGLAYAADGRGPEAIAEYERALRDQPSYPEAHNDLGAALAASGRWKEATDHYQAALRLNPGYAEAHANLGIALAALGSLKEAAEQDGIALRLRPDLPEVHNNLGDLYLRLGRLPEAVPEFERALRLRPDFAEAHYNLGLALRALGRPGEAREHFEKASRLKPTLPPP